MPQGPQRAPAPKHFARRPKAKTKDRGYGSAHEHLRAMLMTKFPLCQVCNAAFSTDLHHIDNNPFNRDPSNCLMVCEHCHHSKIHKE